MQLVAVFEGATRNNNTAAGILLSPCKNPAASDYKPLIG
jgi:hypothetical protein